MEGDRSARRDRRWGALLLLASRAWRSSWRSYLLLGALAAMTTAAVVGLAVGAQRSRTGLDRLRTTTHAATLRIGDGDRRGAELARALLSTDGVIAAGVERELFVRPVGSELIPDYHLLATAHEPGVPGGGPVDTPQIVAGRAPDPTVVDEIAVSEGLAAELGVGVGDQLELETFSDAWVDVAFSGGDPGPVDGPVVPVEVVGLARTPADFGRWQGQIHLTSAFADRYEGEVRTYHYVAARLAEDLADLVVRGGEPELSFTDDLEVEPSPQMGEPATSDGLSTISTGLLLVALAAGLAGLTAVALTGLRMAGDVMSDRTILSAIGWTTGQLQRLATVLLLPAVVAGSVVGVVAGVLLSPRASVGLARSVDPSGNGLVIDLWAVAIAGLAVGAVLMAITGVCGWRAAGARTVRSSRGWALPTLRSPLALGIGLRRALFSSADSGGRASRGAGVGAVAGVAVAIGALVVGASIQRLQDDPALSGQGSRDQRAIDGGEDIAPYEAAMAALLDDERVVDLAGVHVAWDVTAPDGQTVPTLVLDARRGDIGVPLLGGRAPTRRDELAAGPATLEELGADVGDEVELTAQGRTARFEVVGETLFPEGDFRHDQGVVLTIDGADFLGGLDGTALHQVVFRWAPGVDLVAADESLRQAGMSVFTTGEGVAPPVVRNLAEVSGLPGFGAALVVFLALVSALHAMLRTARLRSREVSTLRALGMRPTATAAVVPVHGLALGILAVLAGGPIGWVLGRQVWSLIAARAHVIDHPVVGWPGAAWVAASVVMGSLLASLPAVWASLRRHPLSMLRTE